MTLVQLQVLVAIMEAGSFTAAAERLGMTQSAVSHALATLEQGLGVQLIMRNRRNVVPTAVGQRVVRHARAAITAAEAVRQEALAGNGVVRGRVRLGSFPSVSAGLLPGILRLMQERYPQVEVVLFEGTDDEVHAWISEQVVDIGVVTEPDPCFTVTPLCTDRLVAVVSADDPLTALPQVSAHDLAAEPFILSLAGCEPHIRRFFQQAGAHFEPAYAVRDVTTILAMVREGLGVTMMPQLGLPQPLLGLRTLPLAPAALRHLALAVPADHAVSPAVVAFLAEAAHATQDSADEGVSI